MKNMNLVHGLARLVNDEFNKLFEINNNEALSEALINKSLYQGMHNYCSLDLDLEDYYRWSLEDLGDLTRARFTGYSVQLNNDNNPATYLITGYYLQDDIKLRDAYYRKAMLQLSSMAHELRHAKQLELGMLDDINYVTEEEVGYEVYANQDIEVDAREYQHQVFDNEEVFVELYFRMENR